MDGTKKIMTAKGLKARMPEVINSIPNSKGRIYERCKANRNTKHK